MTVTLGLVGCGAWGWRYIPSALEVGNAKVGYVARVSERSMADERIRGHLAGVVQPKDWRTLASCVVDGVVVATPPESHEEICTYFLERGIPVMVEKPMALSVGAALAIKEAAKKSGAPLLVNNVHLFAPAYEVLRDKVHALSGKRFRVYARAGSSGPHRSYSALWDYGPHDVAMCLGLGLGNPTSVTCMRMPDEFGCVHVGAQRFDMTVGFGRHEANVQVWNGAPPKQRHFEVICDGTRLVYDELEPSGALLRCNNRPVTVSPEKPLTRAVRAFAEAVRTGVTDWRFGAEIGVVTTRILHTADTGIVHA